MSQLMQSPTLLIGDNTIPGVKIPKDILAKIPEILQACRDLGLDFYETIVEFCTYDEISELAAYGGFPVRYPHWQFGEQYEELSKGYQHGMHRIYEMVINTNPCYIYCLDSNTFVDHVTVIAHATGHNDFFKNNVFFSKTSQNMMNELANHGSRIRRYKSEWGGELVGKFIDKILCIDTLIDPAAAWAKREIREPVFRQRREYHHPRRLRVDHDYMEDWINTPEWKNAERERIREEDIKRQIGIFENPTKDIFGFIKDHAPLRPWEQDIIAMLYEEAMYFAPQRQTKMINEGWASYVDSQIMARYGFAEGSGIFDYAAHKAGVLGGQRSMNPYKMGYMLFLWIEECYNKGKFGREYDECTDGREKQMWDKKLGLGHEKVFEVRQFCNDVTMLAEYFDQEFCDKYEFFMWERFPNGEYKIVDRDANRIKQSLLQSKLNGGLPEIKLVDPNHKGKRVFLMEHTWDGRILMPGHTKDTMRALSALWKGPSALLSKDKDGREIMYYCEDDKVDITTPAKI
jgi:stage V sporulation protein R